MLKEREHDKQTYIALNMISVHMKLEINWWGRKQVEPREMAPPSPRILLWWWYLSGAWKRMHNSHCLVRRSVLEAKEIVRGQAERSSCGAYPERGPLRRMPRVHKGQTFCPLTTWTRTLKGVVWRFQFLTKPSFTPELENYLWVNPGCHTWYFQVSLRTHINTYIYFSSQ